MAENTGVLTELTDILDKDIEAIVAMRINAERKVSYHQRLIEKATSALGRPLAVYIILLIVILWIIGNVFHHALGFPVFDSPPFAWLQDIVSISALLMTVIVLATQNRQERFSEQRRHLDLQITLLTERKVSKIIELLEDLRRDLPSVKNRTDLEAEAMQEPVDPHTALNALNHTLQEATKEYELELDK
ncbi:MAG: DUF1003 domain-containing protein [Ktedonobacteraceae bacterium]